MNLRASSRSIAAATTGTLVLTALTLGVPSAHAAEAGGAAAASAPQSCTIAPPANELSESPVGCVTAAVALDRVPGLGETATVTVQLDTEVPIDDAQLAVRLPAGLRIVTDGFSAPTERGLDTVATQDLALDESGRTVTFEVIADVAGPAQIQVDVVDTAQPAEERSAHASTELTIGRTAAESAPGAAGTSSTTHGKNGDADTKRSATEKPKVGEVTAASDAICAVGDLDIADWTGDWRAARRVAVAVLGQTTPDAPAATLATGLTDAEDGSYELCFTSPAPELASLSVEFTTRNAWWEIDDMTGATSYTTRSAPVTDVAAGTVQDFGTSVPSALHMRAFNAFDIHNALYELRGSGTDCWTAEQTTDCEKLKARWAPGNTDGGYYQTAANVRSVYLTDAMPDTLHTVVHEAGHNFQHLLYNWRWPTGDCPSPHSLHRVTGAMCAWTEGFANAVTGYAMGDGRYYYNTTDWMDLMQTGLQDTTIAPARPNPDNGEHVEGRVAGAMISLWRELDGGPEATFRNLDQYDSFDFAEWFNVDRPKSGLSVDRQARDILNEHTIDFRDVRRTESLVNGDLEDQGDGWDVVGGVVGTWSYFGARSGQYYAWMGGNGVASVDSLSRSGVQVPRKGTTVLDFYMRINSPSEDRAVKADKLELQVQSGGQTTTVATWWNGDRVPAYSRRVIDLTQFAGQTVTISFVSTEDDGQQTDFVLDQLSVQTTR
ncbi:hypothetical protein ESP57_09260 [Agromyces fucosus]|uniref:Uncharacterized protein n=1 Tax=Agromyces fucosus TaxID=41985 RepID=A0A4Q2JMC6_9MICO|nr:hypothetical protein [Agromyces fucosus]RXZ49122.1 hypothetical protein ESP57_09260 [Agromyces fucosus]